MRRKILLAAAAAFTVAACAHKHEEPPPPAPPPPPPAPAPVPPPPSGPIAGSVEDFRAAVGDRVFFGYDRSDLTAEARAVLERQAAWLRQYPSVNILVAGNCDERGTREYNLALGARRAAAVRDYLMSLGVEGPRVETTSYGKERPLDPRHTEEAWTINRNSQTQIVSGAVG
jgi:peptidoglycan-associated lipoprotein